MWNKIITTVAFLSLLGMCLFGYLYEKEKTLNSVINIEVNNYKKDIEFRDSINSVLINTNNELDSALTLYEEENSKLNLKLLQIENELNDALANVPVMTFEQLAQYVVDNFLGDTYKMYKENDTTYFAFQYITTKDIVEQDMEFKALNKRFDQLSNKVDISNKLIKKQAIFISKLTNAADTLNNRYSNVIIKNRDYSVKIIELTNELDKQKMIKRIAIITDIGLLILLIAL